MISVGLDLSLTKTGIAILKDGELAYSGLVKSKPSGDTPRQEMVRLQGILTDIEVTLEEHCPDTVNIFALEGLAFMAHNTTALAQLSGLNYLVRDLLMGSPDGWPERTPFIVVAPTSLKKFACSKGNAQKDLILLEIYKRYNQSFTDNNIADAFILAKIGEAVLQPPEDLTQQQLEVVSLVKKQLI